MGVCEISHFPDYLVKFNIYLFIGHSCFIFCEIQVYIFCTFLGQEAYLYFSYRFVKILYMSLALILCCFYELQVSFSSQCLAFSPIL